MPAKFILTVLFISISFFVTALFLYIFDITQLSRLWLLALALLLPAVVTPIINWQHNKRSLLIDEMQDQIKLASRQDDVTGLLSRRFFYETSHRELQLAQRHNYAVSLLLVRLTQLDDISQRLGHVMADYASRGCADMLKDALRETDILGSFSEDSFVVLMPHSSSAEAELVANRLKKKLNSSSLQLKEENVRLDIAVGLSSTTKHFHIQKLIDTAEQSIALSEEKDSITALLVTAS